MKNVPPLGTSATLEEKVGHGATIRLGGKQESEVYATPSMIRLMEFAARKALDGFLDAAEESVGIDVQIAHTSATPPRNIVRSTATVTDVQRNVVVFEVVAQDDWGEIGRGTHRRAVIQLQQFSQQLHDSKPAQSATAQSATAQPPNPTKELDWLVSNQVLQLTINRPAKKNAMTQAMTLQLDAIIEWVATQPEILAVVLRGADGSFCAGDDVSDLPPDRDASIRLSVLRGELLRKISQLPQPAVALIDGLAVGGGCVLAAACDFRIATHRAQFGLPEVSLGWPPNYGMVGLQALVGKARAQQLALTGEMLTASDAKSIGLVERVVATEQLENSANELIGRLLKLPLGAIRATKELLNPYVTWNDEVASIRFADCLENPEAQASIERFRKK